LLLLLVVGADGGRGTELTRAIEQVAHSPGGDELLEEIQGKELLLNHLVHWDGFEKDALLMQPHVMLSGSAQEVRRRLIFFCVSPNERTLTAM